MISVLLADDHQVVRKGLRFYLDMNSEIEVAGEAGNGKEAVSLASEIQPDIVLMDLIMPVMDGIEATEKILKTHPHTKIIILTSFSEKEQVIPALQAGAAGYQLKDIEPEKLIEVIHAVVKGGTELDPKAASRLVQHMHYREQENYLKRLTAREEEVLEKILDGCSNKEISSRLIITEKTVKTHMTNILRKLEVEDRTQAAIYALKNGFNQT
ncbi:response regulator [Alteribacillus sp. HJP-4]|uniref:response regulator n=1 Tax=Alteribacillus sp. HJP-4 TaxID=2775394 RepID=UPI0035CCF642